MYFELSDELHEEVVLNDFAFVHHLQGYDHACVELPKSSNIYLARLTLPNLPSPSRRMILKLSLQSPFPLVLILSGDLVWFLRKEGSIFSDLWVIRCCSVEVVDAVSLRLMRWLVRPPEFLIFRLPVSFSCSLELPFFRFAIFYQLKLRSGTNRWASSPGLIAFEGRGL